MDILYNVFVLLHLIGFAALFGGAFTQMKGPERVVNAAMFHGALTQIISGVVLLGLQEMGDGDVNHAKLGVKFVILVVITVLVVVNRKKTSVPSGAFWAIFGLTLVNAALAVFW